MAIGVCLIASFSLLTHAQRFQVHLTIGTDVDVPKETGLLCIFRYLSDWRQQCHERKIQFQFFYSMQMHAQACV